MAELAQALLGITVAPLVGLVLVKQLVDVFKDLAS